MPSYSDSQHAAACSFKTIDMICCSLSRTPRKGWLGGTAHQRRQCGKIRHESVSTTVPICCGDLNKMLWMVLLRRIEAAASAKHVVGGIGEMVRRQDPDTLSLPIPSTPSRKGKGNTARAEGMGLEDFAVASVAVQEQRLCWPPFRLSDKAGSLPDKAQMSPEPSASRRTWKRSFPPAHHLAGAHKRGAHYSSHRAPFVARASHPRFFQHLSRIRSL